MYIRTWFTDAHNSVLLGSLGEGIFSISVATTLLFDKGPWVEAFRDALSEAVFPSTSAVTLKQICVSLSVEFYIHGTS